MIQAQQPGILDGGLCSRFGRGLRAAYGAEPDRSGVVQSSSFCDSFHCCVSGPPSSDPKERKPCQNLLIARDQRRDIILAGGAFLVALLFWQIQDLYILMYPFRLFVTMIHELGHGVAAVLTGGHFIEFAVTKHGAGITYTSGGSRFVIIQAGYLGTALFGAVLLYLTHRTARPERVAIGVGLFVGILTLAYSGISVSRLGIIETVLVAVMIIAAFYLILTRETDDGRYAGLGVGALGGLLLVYFAGRSNFLTILVGIISALALIGIGLRGSRDMVIVTLTFLACLTGLQAITDAWVLFKIVSLPQAIMPLNDAQSMARDVGGPAAVWAVVWIVMDIAIFGAAVYDVLVKPMRAARSA